MFALLINGFINLLSSLVRIIVYPLNLLITSTIPDISQNITNTTDSITSFFTSLSWPLSIIPQGILNTLVFILLIEIAKHSIYISTHALIKMWNLFQKLKFW